MSETKLQLRFDFMGLLFLVLMTLKLCGVIEWSWWWITAPLWLPIAIFVAVYLFVFIVLK